ncbi:MULTISPECIES: hypothetical protein [unclassified Achromobacter]|uniref:hypothetical protein n=1 Tax=unclassified Achromobacter TaxID=2626865 RepID=UPI000B51B318|nr:MULTISPECIES: hypothetical protein [unclassified Achromobacter]OWT76918.1 hypothetical protein CEY04_12970 [Achromobacter sp. HZ28]OWT77798.1 hypothetical protein CEY05_07465 [Achromobacter sp. HZ34]
MPPNLSPIERDKVSRRLTVALTCGLGIDALLLVVLYGYASEMAEQILQPMFAGLLGAWIGPRYLKW